MNQLKLLFIVFFNLLLVLNAQAEISKLKIVTTTGMIADIVKNVAGDSAEVTALMGSGVDPHLFKPTRSDIARLNSADVVFYNGLLLEGKMTDALIRVATSGKKVYAVTELLDQEYLLEPAEFQGHFDPHVWMDPIAWKAAVEVVSEKLSELLPEQKAVFEANAQTYFSELDALAKYAETVIASIPQTTRVLVTAHDAFNYFGRRYGLEVMGIQGISTESEAGVRDIEKIVNILVERKIKAVFIESTVSEKNIRALIEGAKAQGHQVIIGGSLFSDAMGKDGKYEGTYLGMIDHNVTTIVRALGGSAPEKGRIGKLALP
jgi:manganese/zinc/iron transport system substrate-binding protein